MRDRRSLEYSIAVHPQILRDEIPNIDESKFQVGEGFAGQIECIISENSNSSSNCFLVFTPRLRNKSMR